MPADWGHEVGTLVEDGRPGDALAYWMTTVIGVPAGMVDGLGHEPLFTAMEPNAEYRSVPGRPHNLPMEVLVAEVRDFLTS